MTYTITPRTTKGLLGRFPERTIYDLTIDGRYDSTWDSREDAEVRAQTVRRDREYDASLTNAERDDLSGC